MASVGHYKTEAIQEVFYGKSAQDSLKEIISSQDGEKRIVFVTNTSLTKKGGLADQVKMALGNNLVGELQGLKAHSPRADVMSLMALLKKTKADMVVTLGGGSVCDATKVACIALENNIQSAGDIANLATATKLNPPQVRHIAIPTTLSAGEYTGFAGITDESIPRKELYYHASMVPNIVILDSAMTVDTPDRLFFGTGIRAVDHCVETWCSVDANPIVEATALRGLQLLVNGLRVCKADHKNLGSRLDCLVGAWLSIQGVANGVSLGASHGIGHILGGTAGMPHGETSCVMLPHVLRYNAASNSAQQNVLAEIMGNNKTELADHIQQLVAELELPGRLRDADVPKELLRTLAEESLLDIWIATNPHPINTADEIFTLLTEAW